jgi:hypothetical protein
MAKRQQYTKEFKLEAVRLWKLSAGQRRPSPENWVCDATTSINGRTSSTTLMRRHFPARAAAPIAPMN